MRLDLDLFDHLRAIAQKQRSWICQLPLSPTAQDSIPVHLSLNAQSLTDDTLEIQPRLNLIFHSLNGFVLAGSGYSIRDHPISITQSSRILPLHGSIKWFMGHTFDSHNTSSYPTKHGPIYRGRIPTASDLVDSVRPSIVLLWISLTATLSITGCVLVYQGLLKPKLLSNLSKKSS